MIRKEKRAVKLGYVAPIRSDKEYEDSLLILMGAVTVSDEVVILREQARVRAYERVSGDTDTLRVLEYEESRRRCS